MKERQPICFRIGIQDQKFHGILCRQIRTENMHPCEHSYFFPFVFFPLFVFFPFVSFFGTWLFNQFIPFCLLCQLVIFHGHVCRRYNRDCFVPVWIFWFSFTIKSINACVDSYSDCNAVEKDLLTFYSASTVWFIKMYLNNAVWQYFSDIVNHYYLNY